MPTGTFPKPNAPQVDGAPQQSQPAKPAFQAPSTKQVAPTLDPNYQTLAGLSNDDIFKPKGTPPAPTKPTFQAPKHQVAPATDPNYQTLNGLCNDDIFKPKESTCSCKTKLPGSLFQGNPPAPTKPTFQAPKPQVAPATDPNYQTLNGLTNDDIFKPKGNPPASTKPKFQAPNPQIAPATDPNYQTLNGLTNDDIFKPKGNPPSPSKPTFQAPTPQIATATDPNYQTLNGLTNDDIFKPK
ncbi:hypothetical protein ANCCEY_00156, partial [Ancylostoma ceylanicum]